MDASSTKQSPSKPSCVKTGYLFKKGRGIKLSLFKPWSYRWFSLDLSTGVLRYFEEIDGRRVLKGEVDASVGQVAELQGKLSGRDNCFEVLCRRIDKNDSSKVSHNMEVLTLSAVYKSQMKEWKDCLTSINQSIKTAADLSNPAEEDRRGGLYQVDRNSWRNLPLTASPYATAPTLKPSVKMNENDHRKENQELSSPKIFPRTYSATDAGDLGSRATKKTGEPSVDTKAASLPAVPVQPPQESFLGRVLDLDNLLDDFNRSNEELAPKSPTAGTQARTADGCDINEESENVSSTEYPSEPDLQPSGRIQFTEDEEPQTENRTDASRSSDVSLSFHPTEVTRVSTETPPQRYSSGDVTNDEASRDISPTEYLVKSVNLSREKRNKEHEIINGYKLGYLFKKGRGRSISFVKPWSHRWCALDLVTGRMSYHLEENGIRTLKGDFFVSNGTVFELDGKLVGRQFAFDISCTTRDFVSINRSPNISETVTFAASNKSEMEGWLYALSLVEGCKIVRLDGSIQSNPLAVEDDAAAVDRYSNDMRSPSHASEQSSDSESENQNIVDVPERLGAQEPVQSSSKTVDRVESIWSTTPQRHGYINGQANSGILPKLNESTSDIMDKSTKIDVQDVFSNKTSVIGKEFELEDIEIPVMEFPEYISPVRSEYENSNDDVYFPVEKIEEQEDEYNWGVASAQALIDFLTEENKELKGLLVEAAAENENLRKQLEEARQVYLDEMKAKEEAHAEKLTELEGKWLAAMEQLSSAQDRIDSKSTITDPVFFPEPDDLKAEMQLSLQTDLRIDSKIQSMMTSDLDECVPLPPFDMWDSPLTGQVIDAVLSADCLKKPLVILQDNEGSVVSSVASGKTTIASIACRSSQIKSKFSGNVLWLHVGDYEKHYVKSSYYKDWDHCVLLEMLADKIRKRVSPWLVRKLKKSRMTARDWRLYISDLLHVVKTSSNCWQSQSDSETIDQLSKQSTDSEFSKYLLVLDDVRDASIITSLGFLGFVTLVTTRFKFELASFGVSITMDSMDAGPSKRVTNSGSSESLNSNAQSVESSGSRTQNCVFRRAIYQNEKYYSEGSNECSVPILLSRYNLRDSSSKKESNNMSSIFIKMTQEDQYRLLALSFLPHGVVLPLSLAKALWDTDLQAARGYSNNLFATSWISLCSPGDAFNIHSLCLQFLNSQLQRLPSLTQQNIKDKSIKNIIKWIVSEEAYHPVNFRQGFDWSYIALMCHINKSELLSSFQEKFVELFQNMKFLTSSDKRRTLYFIDYAASLVLRVPLINEDLSWCDDWIRKSLQMKSDSMSEQTIASDLFVFRDVFGVLLDCCAKQVVCVDIINYLDRILSCQRRLDVKKSSGSIVSAECLIFLGCVHIAANRYHRASECFKEAVSLLRDKTTLPGIISLIDSVLTFQVVSKLKQIDTEANLGVSSSEYGIVNEFLDEAMAMRKVYLGCEEHPRLTDILQLSGEVWSRVAGGLGMSKKLLKATFMMRCLQFEEAHPITISMFEQMALSLECVQKFASALPYYQNLTANARKTFGEFSPNFILSVILLSCNLCSLSRRDEALSTVKKSLSKIRQIALTTSEFTSTEPNTKTRRTNFCESPQLSRGCDHGISVSYLILYGLLVLCYTFIVQSTNADFIKGEILKTKKLMLEVLKLMHREKLSMCKQAVEHRTLELCDAIVACILFKLGSINEDNRDFLKAKRFYSGASTTFAEVGDKYHLCSILSLVRLSACEVNLGELEDCRHLLNAASEALDDVIVNGLPDSFPGMQQQGVYNVVDLTYESRFYCLLFRLMEWQGLLLPNAAEDMKDAVDKLLNAASKESDRNIL